MEEWKEYRIGDTSIMLIDGDRGKNYPSQNEFSSIGYCLFLNAGNVTKNGFSFENNSFITKEKDNLLRNGKLERGDVVITTRGTVGNVALYKNGIPYEHMRINSGMLIVRGGCDLNSEYLYYYIKSQLFQNQILQMKTGSAQPQLPKSTVNNMIIRYPESLQTQQKIASILSSLDDKIEVNRRINEQLEELAQALFKSWFVDFEPFKDSEFVESELGMIPKGWKVLSFNDFINPSSEKVFVGELPEYSVTNNGIIPRDEKFKKQLSKTTSKNKVLKKNNLVFGMSRDILNWGIMEDLIGGVSSAYNVYIIDERQICPTYLRLYMSSKIAYFNDLIGNAAREGQSLDKAALLNKKVYFPNDNIWHDFFERYSTIKDNILIREEEITHLTALRDTLLPKLMSGEMDVNEVEL